MLSTKILLLLVCALVCGSNAFKMDYTKLGSSDLMVSKVCLGTMTWGQQNTLAEGVEQLDIAFKEYGVNFLDTAEIYPVPTKAATQGETDRIIASWLKTQDRSKVVLATKIAGASMQMKYLPGRNGQGSRVSPKEIRVSVDESLKRLGTDYIDLLQIHWPDRYVPLFGAGTYRYENERDSESFESQMRALDELVKEGRVRAVGVSNETPYGCMKFAEASRALGLTRMCSIQNSYSLIVRSDFESSLVEVCSPRNEDIGLLAYSPLAGGILTGKYAKPNCPSTARLNLFEGYMARYRNSIASEAVVQYSKVAEKHGLSPAELALVFTYSQPFVASTIIGATSIQQLRENIGAYAKKDKATKELLDDINAVYRRYRDPSKVEA